MRENMWYLSFYVYFILLNMLIYISIPFAANIIVPFFFMAV
jgi:hypothetical protein